MTEYGSIRIEKKLFDAISKLADETNRTNVGMVKEMFEAYIRSSPVAGRVEGDKVIWGNDCERE